MISVFNERCCGCGGCCCACPIDAIFIQNSKIRIKSNCTECGKCIPFCPHGALYLEQKSTSWPAIRPPENQYDVIVIGGGPAGSTAARVAAEKGAKVLLIEKKPVVGAPQLCAEGISHTGLTDVMPIIRERWIAAPIIGAILVSPSGLKTTVRHPKAGYILERRVFDRDLFAMAGEKGVKVLVSATAREFVWEHDCIVGLNIDWRGESLTIKSKIFICADGVEATMAKSLFPREYLAPDQMHVAAQVVMTGINLQEGFPEFHVGKELAPGGYAWVFPKGEDIANVGIGINPSVYLETKATAWSLLKKFIDTRFGNDGEIIEIASGNVPTAKRLEKIAYRNVLFAGDAGRLSDPISGGGLANALLSGKLAGDIAAVSINGKSPEETEKILAVYASSWDRAKGKQMSFYWKAKNIFASLENSDIESICKIIDDRFGRNSFDGIDIPGTIKAIISERKLLWRFAKSLLPSKK
ncbi:geranylgeranyl reductase family protein [bacterium]|nr:geranylgeranyl reductase family protein [bacterium]